MTETVKGRVQAISPKPSKDHMGLKLDNDEWYNGNDEDFPKMSKGDKLKITHDNEWVQEIDIIEEANEGEDSSQSSDAISGSGSSNTGQTSSNNNMSPRQQGITANSAVKLAVENAETDYTDDKAAHLDEVDEKSQAYSNMIQDRLREIQE